MKGQGRGGESKPIGKQGQTTLDYYRYKQKKDLAAHRLGRTRTVYTVESSSYHLLPSQQYLLRGWGSTDSRLSFFWRCLFVLTQSPAERRKLLLVPPRVYFT